MRKKNLFLHVEKTRMQRVFPQQGKDAPPYLEATCPAIGKLVSFTGSVSLMDPADVELQL